MYSYLLETTVYWAAFYLLYRFFLRKETFFKTNRFYLIGTFFLGALVPLFEVATYIPAENPFEVLLPTIQILSDPTGPVAAIETTNSIPWSTILLGIYLLGALFSYSRFLLGLSKIKGLISRGEKANLSGFSVIKTKEIKTPFSFLKNLFWSSHLDHYPMVYAYKHSIREVHEFLADDYVIRQSNKQQYGHLLIGQSKTFANLMAGKNSLALANHFFHSQLKKRIMMMTKKKSNKQAILKYFLLLPLVSILVFACEKTAVNEFSDYDKTLVKEAAAENDSGEEFVTDTVITFNPETYEETMQIVKSSVYKVVEQMPRFPGCEDETGGIDAIEKCAQMKLLEHIYSNIKYPETARKEGIEGTSVVSFIVGNYGNVFDAKVLRSVHPDCDAEVLRIVEAMPPWIAGEQNGEKVNVRFNLPVKFKLSGGTAVISSDKNSSKKKMK